MVVPLMLVLAWQLKRLLPCCLSRLPFYVRHLPLASEDRCPWPSLKTWLPAAVLLAQLWHFGLAARGCSGHTASGFCGWSVLVRLAQC